MPEEPNGTEPPEGQAPPETSSPAEEAPVQSPTPQIPAEIQAEMEALKLRAQQAEQSARFQQSQADRFRAALGAPNQPDPNQQVEQFAKQLAAKHGMNVDDAKRLLPFIQDLQAPFLQEINSLKASQINGQAVETAMRAAFQQNPTLLGQPGIYEQTEASLRASIANNPNPLPIEELQRSAIFTAGGLAAIAPKPAAGKAAPPLQQPSFRSMTGIQPGVGAPAAVQTANPSETQLKMRGLFDAAIKNSQRKP